MSYPQVQSQSIGIKRFVFSTQNLILSSLKVLTALIVSALICGAAQAHLMVAQHGTLNFLDDSAYVVLSLPSSAFIDADDDKDGLLSITEFAEHRLDIIARVSEQVTLGAKSGKKIEKFVLNNIMVSPVTPHDAPKDPANQIIVMGRYALAGNTDELYFHIGIFGESSEFQTLEITASRKSTDSKHVFDMTPSSNLSKLNFD